MKFRNLVVAAAGACLLALTSFAQITAIEGDVKGEDGSPAVKAQVKIVRTDIKGSYKCETNKKGHYFYNGLPLGTYNITVEVGGKEMDGVNGVRTRLGRPHSGQLRLAPARAEEGCPECADAGCRGRHRARALQRAGTRHDQGAEGSLRQGHQRPRTVDEEEQGTQRRVLGRHDRHASEGLRHRRSPA